VLFLIPKLHFFTKLVGASLTAKLFFPCMFSGSSPQKIADCFCVIFDFFLSSSYLFSPQFFSPLFLLDSLCHNHLLYNYGCLLNGPYSLLLLPSFHCPEYYPLVFQRMNSYVCELQAKSFETWPLSIYIFSRHRVYF
jgi:hypothetical protein